MANTMAEVIINSDDGNFTGNLSLLSGSNQTAGQQQPAGAYHEQYTVYIIGIICVSFAVVGITFNSLTIIVIVKGERIGKELKFQLVNLAAADLMTAPSFPIYLMFRLLRLNFPQNDALCKFVGMFSIWPNFVSLLWNMIISMERLLVIYFPLRMRHYSLKLKVLVAIFVWGIGFALRANSLINSRVSFLGTISICYVGESTGFYSDKKGLDESINMATYGIPALVIIVSYTMISFKLYLKPKIGYGGSSHQENSSARQMSQVRIIY